MLFEILLPYAVLSLFEGCIEICVGFSQARILFPSFVWFSLKTVGGLHQEQQPLPGDIPAEGSVIISLLLKLGGGKHGVLLLSSLVLPKLSPLPSPANILLKSLSLCSIKCKSRHLQAIFYL